MAEYKFSKLVVVGSSPIIRSVDNDCDLMSKLTEFYRGEGTDNVGRTFDDIMRMSDAALEIAHDWVQWVFPLQALSNFNEDAPIPTADDLQIMRTDYNIISNFTRACNRFFSYLGLSENDVYDIEPAENFEERRKLVWKSFNHNYLRVTRFLDSMRLMGQKKRSAALYRCLMDLAAKDQIYLSENGRQFWEKTQESV